MNPAASSSVPPSMVVLRKATIMALTVPDLSFIVYQTDWPPLFVSAGSTSAPPGEVWMTVCPSMFRAVLIGEHDGDAERVVGPTLGDEECEIQIDLVPNGSTEVDAAGVFAVTGDEGFGVVGFAAAAAGSCFDPAQPPLAETLPCGRVAEMAPPSVVEVDVDLGVGVAGWKYALRDQPAEQLARHFAFESLLAMSVDEAVRHVADIS
ncbi:MAG: hypothetical protein AAGC53_04580 [Actinomycetota bacterium]